MNRENSRDIIFIKHILEEINKIEKSTHGMTEDAFKKDADVQDAIIRRLEVIGEATKGILC